MLTTTHPTDLNIAVPDTLSAMGATEAGKAVTNLRKRCVGTWEEAVFNKEGVLLAAWAIDANSLSPPAAFEFRWDGKTVRFENLITRPDVGRAHGCEAPICGLRTSMSLGFHDIPPDANTLMPTLVAIWADGTELALKPAAQATGFQFRFFGFTERADFDRHFQNPAFRVGNLAAIAWASRRAIDVFPDDVVCFMSAFCIMIYRHIESGYFSADEISRLREKWDRVETTLPQPLRGEIYRWVISVKLGLGYFYMIAGDLPEAAKNFSAIAEMEDELPSWPQASTNILIGVFMAAWLDYRRKDEATALRRLARAYEILKTGVFHLPIWSKHHFAELENSMRIARECFAFQKLLEGETRDHILPLNSSKLTFRLISLVLTGMLDRGQVEDGPFPARGEYPPSPALRA